MPQASNITIVDADSTSVEFTCIIPASGDQTSSVFRYLPTGKPANCAEVLEINTRWNGPKTVRRVDGSFVYPISATDSLTGKVSKTDAFSMKVSTGVLQNVPPAEAVKAWDHFTLLMRDALIREIAASGYNAS